MSNRSMLLIAILFLTHTGGCAQMRGLNDFGGRLRDRFTGNTPRAAAVRMEDQYFPDERRQGINELVRRDFGKGEIYTERYAQIAQRDDDHLVRATAIRALNRARDTKSIPLFIKALEDESDLVQLEGAKALVNMPHASAVPALTRVVNSATANRDVRIAAAEALKHYKNPDVARALIGQLRNREFGLAWQARQSLMRMSGRDHRYNDAAWTNLLADPDKPLG